MSKQLKSGVEVVVIAGAHKGRRGRVMSYLPAKNRVIVEGVNLRKKHEKKTQENPEGAIVEREAPLHRSNVMLASEFDARAKKRSEKTATA